MDSKEPTDIQFRKGVNANHIHAIKNAMDMALADRRAKEAIEAPLKKVNMCKLYTRVLKIQTPSHLMELLQQPLFMVVVRP